MVLDSVVAIVPLQTDQDGVIRISDTRVTLDTIVLAFKDGATAEEIAQQYQSVPLADVYSVIGFYLHSHNEVEAYLNARQREAENVRALNESRNDPDGIRERLMVRQAKP